MSKIKCLISSPSHFTGEYSNDFCRIKHAWNFNQPTGYNNNTDEQHFFVLDLGYNNDKQYTEIQKHYLNDNGQIFCSILSVFFGKIFYSHGAFENDNLYIVPDVKYIKHKYKNMLPFNSKIRKDTKISPKLGELTKIEKILSININQDFRSFIAAAKQYMLGLSFADKDPDIAYISLVQSGEILSNSIQPSTDKLIDPEIQKIISEIELLDDGTRKSNLIRSRMFQIKKKYTTVLESMIDNPFYSNSPSEHEIYALNKSNISELLKGSYDLRSFYVHNGESFGELTLTDPLFNYEFNNGYTDKMSKDLKRILGKSLSFCGLERVIHYCLYKRLLYYTKSSQTTSNRE